MTEVLRAITMLLAAEAIPHMVVGSLASALYGEPRSTRDIDIVVDPTAAQLDAFLAALDPQQYYVDTDVARDALRRRSMFNIIDIANAWKLDLVVRKARPFSIEELSRRKPMPLFGAMVATATAEDTIIAKLEWAKQGGSDRQLEDVAGILRVQGDALDRGYIERWVDELGLREQWTRVLS